MLDITLFGFDLVFEDISSGHNIVRIVVFRAGSYFICHSDSDEKSVQDLFFALFRKGALSNVYFRLFEESVPTSLPIFFIKNGGILYQRGKLVENERARFVAQVVRKCLQEDAFFSFSGKWERTLQFLYHYKVPIS